MATGNFVLDKGYDADGPIVKFRAVKLSGQGEGCAQVDDPADMTLGIAQFRVTDTEITRGKGASVRLMGISEMECGAAVARGDEVACDEFGRAVPATYEARTIGVAHSAGGAAGNVISVFLALPGRLFAPDVVS